MSDATHNAAIDAAGRRYLSPLGLARVGRSRLWTDDHAWWITNVEFQPSSSGPGSYLNVGVQWLWMEAEQHAFMVGHREEGFHRAEHGRDFTEYAERLALRAVSEVERYRSLFPDLPAVARYYLHPLDAGQGPVGPEDWPPAARIHAGIALGLLGDEGKARRWFDSYLSVSDDRDWAQRDRDHVLHLRALLSRPSDFKLAAQEAVLRSRVNLGLPILDSVTFLRNEVE